MSKVLEDAEIERAREAAQAADTAEPRATAVRYECTSGRLVIELRSGVALMVPVDLLQGVAGAAPEAIEQVEIEGGGVGLHWESLDADLSVPGLVAGLFGTGQWMAWLAVAAPEPSKRAA